MHVNVHGHLIEIHQVFTKNKRLDTFLRVVYRRKERHIKIECIEIVKILLPYRNLSESRDKHCTHEYKFSHSLQFVHTSSLLIHKRNYLKSLCTKEVKGQVIKYIKLNFLDLLHYCPLMLKLHSPKDIYFIISKGFLKADTF